MARRTRKIRTSHVHGTKKIVLHSQSENKWSSAPENFFPVIDPNLTAQTIQQAIHVEVKERISLPVRYPTGFPRTSHSGRWAVPCAPVSARRTCPEDSRVHSMVQPRSGGACRRLAWPPWTGIDRSWRKEAVGSTCVAQLQAWYPARSDRLPQRRASPACAAAPAKGDAGKADRRRADTSNVAYLVFPVRRGRVGRVYAAGCRAAVAGCAAAVGCAPSSKTAPVRADRLVGETRLAPAGPPQPASTSDASRRGNSACAATELSGPASPLAPGMTVPGGAAEAGDSR